MTNVQSAVRNLTMVNKTCQQQHVIIDQPVEKLDKQNSQYGGTQALNPWEQR